MNNCPLPRCSHGTLCPFQERKKNCPMTPIHSKMVSTWPQNRWQAMRHDPWEFSKYCVLIHSSDQSVGHIRVIKPVLHDILVALMTIYQCQHLNHDRHIGPECFKLMSKADVAFGRRVTRSPMGYPGREGHRITSDFNNHNFTRTWEFVWC